ncbi:1-phosphatidylinositol 4,5-bisphosphate phosphodiesterase gamma-1-like isoform X4 [Mytilus trossulus]|uniref:1-phosphatidylinositol 4,5-bisphosphate phosphodiesterase gamma-1-like isoform X4 n=1 Tax=Mytilus trossulus TaxID=6551 RepID=UPI0030062938
MAALYNGNQIENDDWARFRSLERGLVVTIFFGKNKRPEKRTLQVRIETRQLVWIRAQGGKPEGSLNLREVREVREGKNSKDFEKWPDDARKMDNALCFVIFYGSEFKLKNLSLVASSLDEYRTWKFGLQKLEESAKNATYQIQLERWLRREFYLMEKSGADTVTLKHFKAWMQKINCKINNKDLRDKFQEVAKMSESIPYQYFILLFKKIIHVPWIIDNYLESFADYQNSKKLISPNKFQQFLMNEQKESWAENMPQVKTMMVDFVADAMRHKGNIYFEDNEFEDYLFSSANSIWDSEYDKVSQNMDLPLSNYWIASSHNTYLTGDQVSSNSSVDAYVRCLRMGCRCIELDCWDGPDSYPSIFHGHTLTSKIKFLDVIQAIKEHAWTASDYPLILSIENHCGLGQQRNMAMAFKDTFGEDLLMDPVEPLDMSKLPSPYKLRRKIIIKHKKLPREGSEDQFVTVRSSDERDNDISSSAIKTGVLYLEDPMEPTFQSKVWHPHFFALTAFRLFYTKETDQDNDDEIDEDLLSQSQTQNQSSTELHYSEKWFHGKLEGGRRKADELLNNHSYLGDGTFLVRESETFIGDYSLSFWRRGETQHCRIKTKQELGQLKYYLIETALFDSLYDLITNYRHNPVRGQDFSMRLSEPVPQINSHEGKEWYHDNMERVDAEDMLRRIQNDGAFLLRRGAQNNYAISFRADNKVKHCRIEVDGRLFVIGEAQFESLVDLVQYYEKNPLYNRIKLKYPVNQTVVERRGSVLIPDDDENSIYGDGIYHSPNQLVSKLKVKAIADYQANRADELSFNKGSIITNVNKADGGWWRGDFNDKRQNWFPEHLVEELDLPEESEDTSPLGALQKGFIDIQGCRVETSGRADKPFTFMIYTRTSPQPLEVAADNESDMREWMGIIANCTQQTQQTKQKDKQLERKKCLARDLSDLIVYAVAVPFDLDRALKGPINCCEMSSFSEMKVEKYLTRHQAASFVKYNTKQLSRVYPKGSRMDSSNYDPMPMWNCGCQMVSLNYQTPDRSMQLNEGRFMRNGRCGYVLQPDVMRAKDYSPFSKQCLQNVDPLTLHITVLGARHLLKSGRGFACPFVEIEIAGTETDNSKFKTPKIDDNGLNPTWRENCSNTFDITCPELALIRFMVQDEDVFGEPKFLGQATFPVSCLRTGYRSVPIQNGYSEELEMAALLVHIDKKNPRESEESDIYACIQDLRDKKKDLEEQIGTYQKEGKQQGVQRLMEELSLTEENLLAKNDERRQRKKYQKILGIDDFKRSHEMQSAGHSSIKKQESVAAFGHNPKRHEIVKHQNSAPMLGRKQESMKGSVEDLTAKGDEEKRSQRKKYQRILGIDEDIASSEDEKMLMYQRVAKQEKNQYFEIEEIRAQKKKRSKEKN